MVSSTLNPMAKEFCSITQITNEERDEVQEIFTTPPNQSIYHSSPELPDSGFLTADLYPPPKIQEAKPTMANELPVLACKGIETTPETKQRKATKVVPPISDYPLHEDPEYIAWVRKIRTELHQREAQPKYESKLLDSEILAERKRFSSIQDRLRFLGIDRSPFVPKSFSEHLYLRERGIEAKRIQLQHRIKNVAYSRKVTVPCFGGQDFGFGRFP